MNKILFICEGEKAEKKFCNLIIDKFFIQKNKPKEFVAFGTNIYGLYDELSKDNIIDIVELIKEKAKAKKDMYNYNKLNEGGFAEVYLIFDFDHHAPQYDQEKISKMVEFFDNETENGKLYINYPMLESFKHFKEIPDNDFNSYKVSTKECLTYKELIGKISIIPHYNDITEETLNIIIRQNIEKYFHLTNTLLKNYNNYLNDFSQQKLLTHQLNNLNKEDSIFVLNTSLFWGIDYFGEKYFNNIINLK